MDEGQAFIRNLFPIDKMSYTRGKKPDVRCILCAILKNDRKVKKLTLFDSGLSSVSVNLYPYTPGHLMVFPKRHVTDILRLSPEEWTDIIYCIKKCVRVLKKAYNPKGFNIGINMGPAAGASIRHIHFHIVPRYNNEIGFVDILSGAKIYIEHPKQTLRKLKAEFMRLEQQP